MQSPIQSYFVRIRGDRVVVENLATHEWVELDGLDAVGPQIECWAQAAPGASRALSAVPHETPRPVPLEAARRARGPRSAS